jgi:pimeloyl-ACP methyl ester carboxylesterase
MPIHATPSGAVINWDSFGDPDAPPLVLIQGFSAQMLGWHPEFCAALAEAGFRVIRFDNRDVGRSQRYPTGGYRLPDLADDTAALIAGLGLGAAHVVGQSMGGMIAQHLAVEHPEVVASLGLLYTSASLVHIIGADDAVAGVPTLTQSRDGFIASYVAAERNCRSEAYEQDVAWLADLGGQMYDAGFDPAGLARQVECILSYTDRSEADRAITVPTTILAGSTDRLIDPAASVELHDIIAGSTLRIFSGMGHEVPRALWADIVGELAANARLASSPLAHTAGGR